VPATSDIELMNDPIQIFLQLLYEKWLVKVVAHPNVQERTERKEVCQRRVTVSC